MMKMERTMTRSSSLNWGGFDRGKDTLGYGGKGIIKPYFGFGTAYGIGQPVWKKGSPFVFVSFCEALRDIPGVEGFGPDKNGNLISLGTLARGWIIISGDHGGIVKHQ